MVGSSPTNHQEGVIYHGHLLVFQRPVGGYVGENQRFHLHLISLRSADSTAILTLLLLRS